MLAGIALMGIVTASLASWLIDKVREVEEYTQAATRADALALAVEVRALRDELAVRASYLREGTMEGPPRRENWAAWEFAVLCQQLRISSLHGG